MKRKDILFGKDATSSILSGLDKATKAVGSTLGAGGNTVLIQSDYHTSGITTTKDGVTVMRSIILEDNPEDLAVRLLREAANQTVSQAGDGTTTSVVLAEVMARNAIERLGPNNNVTTVAEIMKNIAESTAEMLQEKSIPVSGNKEELFHVATVSANNDEEIGKIIADAYKAVGDDGVVTVENSKTQDTYFDLTKGVKFDRGLMSMFHITNHRNRIGELENPYVLVTDLKIPSVKSIERFLIKASENNRPLLIIGELEPEAMQTLDKNIVKGNIKAAYVLPPGFGASRENLMNDLAIAVGAEYITHRTGTDWGTVDMKALGEAHKVIISRSDTAIINNSEDLSLPVLERIGDLKNQEKKSESLVEMEQLRERIANLSGSVATVYVGGKTEGEVKEKRDRVEDAVLATSAALDQGILPGGGIALLRMARKVNLKKKNRLQRMLSWILPNKKLSNQDLAREIMDIAFAAPFSKILENASRNPDAVYKNLNSKFNEGYDVKHNMYGDMIEMGIIDPSKITCSALLNATSAAVTIMKTSALIYDKKEDEIKEQIYSNR